MRKVSECYAKPAICGLFMRLTPKKSKKPNKNAINWTNEDFSVKRAKADGPRFSTLSLLKFDHAGNLVAETAAGPQHPN